MRWAPHFCVNCPCNKCSKDEPLTCRLHRRNKNAPNSSHFLDFPTRHSIQYESGWGHCRVRGTKRRRGRPRLPQSVHIRPISLRHFLPPPSGSSQRVTITARIPICLIAVNTVRSNALCSDGAAPRGPFSMGGTGHVLCCGHSLPLGHITKLPP